MNEETKLGEKNYLLTKRIIHENDFLQGLLPTTPITTTLIKRPIHYCCMVTRFLI